MHLGWNAVPPVPVQFTPVAYTALAAAPVGNVVVVTLLSASYARVVVLPGVPPTARASVVVATSLFAVHDCDRDRFNASFDAVTPLCVDLNTDALPLGLVIVV